MGLSFANREADWARRAVAAVGLGECCPASGQRPVSGHERVVRVLIKEASRTDGGQSPAALSIGFRDLEASPHPHHFLSIKSIT
jgi:hypothetical protein